MRHLFLPAILGLSGLIGGAGAGLFLKPQAEIDAHESGVTSGEAGTMGDVTGQGHAEVGAETHSDDAGTGQEYVKLNNQFVVPVVEQGRVSAMVVLSLSLEVDPGNTEAVYQREPKLRDAFLQVMFDHANVGGFSGSFTDASNLVVLRTSLKEAAALILGTSIRDVLITDIARQDS